MISFLNKKKRIRIEMVHIQNLDNKNLTEFWFKLNKNVFNLRINIFSSNKKDEIITEKELKFFKNKWYMLAGYEDIKDGQKWKFDFTGFIDKSSKKFRNIINYKI